MAGDLDRETGEPAAIVWLPTTLFDVGSVGWQQDGAALQGAPGLSTRAGRRAAITRNSV